LTPLIKYYEEKSKDRNYNVGSNTTPLKSFSQQLRRNTRPSTPQNLIAWDNDSLGGGSQKTILQVHKREQNSNTAVFVTTEVDVEVCSIAEEYTIQGQKVVG